jgi:hypothetical protein
MKSLLGLGITFLWALPLGAADTFPDVEYISGRAGLKDKIKGTLVVDEQAIRFQDRKGKPVFSIPLEHVVAAVQSRDRDEGSFGRKMALGIFASKTEEFLRVETKSPEGADVVTFKTKKNQSPAMAAKINFQKEKAKTP